MMNVVSTALWQRILEGFVCECMCAVIFQLPKRGGAHWDGKKSPFPAKEKGGRYVIKWRFLAVNFELSESAIVKK